MYRTVQEAHDAASNGDIIYLEPSENGYGNLVSTKSLKIYGNGYNHVNNPGNWQNYYKKNSQIGEVYLNTGSAGSSFEGLTILFMNINSSNNLIKRCIFWQAISIYNNPDNNQLGSNITFSQCHFADTYSENIKIIGGVDISNTNHYVDNILIKNCIHPRLSINLLRIAPDIPSARNLSLISNTEVYSFGNCINCIVNNNIFNLTYGPGIITNGKLHGSVFSNNVCITGPCVQGVNNIENIIASDVYDMTQNGEGWYQVSNSSPAKGAGLGGIDPGVFGGNDPYRLSGLPAIPQITSYSVNASSGIYTSSTPMTISISVKGNN
jgi:hypothetical protein